MHENREEMCRQLLERAYEREAAMHSAYLRMLRQIYVAVAIAGNATVLLVYLAVSDRLG